MKPVIKQVPRFSGGYARANRILRIDLDNMAIDVQESRPYLPEYLGARGLAARICWEEVPEPVEPFSPANPLMIVPGALRGKPDPKRNDGTIRVRIIQFGAETSFLNRDKGG